MKPWFRDALEHAESRYDFKVNVLPAGDGMSVVLEAQPVNMLFVSVLVHELLAGQEATLVLIPYCVYRAVLGSQSAPVWMALKM